MCDILCFSQNVCFVRHIQLHTPNLVTILIFRIFVLHFSVYTHFSRILFANFDIITILTIFTQANCLLTFPYPLAIIST